MLEHLGRIPAANLWVLLQRFLSSWGFLGTRGLLASPMQLAWEALPAKAHTNHKAQEQAANLVQAQWGVQREMIQAQREVIQMQREMIQVQWELAQANRVTADVMLIAMREAQGCGVVPFQEDELQAWFHDVQGVAAIARASVVGYGNAAVGCEVLKVPAFGSHCETQSPSSPL